MSLGDAVIFGDGRGGKLSFNLLSSSVCSASGQVQAREQEIACASVVELLSISHLEPESSALLEALPYFARAKFFFRPDS